MGIFSSLTDSDHPLLSSSLTCTYTMKFGKTLLKNQIPEWSRNYINYKALKKRVNRAEEESRLGKQQTCDDSVAGRSELLYSPITSCKRYHSPFSNSWVAIFFALDRELEKVNGFYTYKRGEIDRRLWVLSEKFKQHNAATVHAIQSPVHQSEFLMTPQNQRPLDNPHANSQFVNALRETLEQLNKLMWFAELNNKGFGKILKK